MEWPIGAAPDRCRSHALARLPNRAAILLAQWASKFGWFRHGALCAEGAKRCTLPEWQYCR